MTSHPWVSRISSPRPDCPAVLLFPHAGSGASTYQRWRRMVPQAVDVLAVQLPGRETRLDEPLIRDLPVLVDAVTDGLSKMLDRPFAFFGHSVGALIAFETTRLLRRRGQPQPACLGLSAFPAPSTLVPQSLHELPDDVILKFLRDLSYFPERLASQKGYVEMFLPALKADFALASNYRPSPEEPLSCPVHVFGADADPFAKPGQLDAWSEYAGADFSCSIFPGGHFYLYEHGAEILKKVTRPLAELAGADHRTPEVRDDG